MDWKPVAEYDALPAGTEEEHETLLLGTVGAGGQNYYATGYIYERRNGEKKAIVSGWQGVNWTHYVVIDALPTQGQDHD